MADLPSGRLQVNKPPFSHVGVDYFGPFLVAQGRSKAKRYGCIFTCLTVRAVHLDISHNLTTDSFINALRRFIARRGPPEQFYSDNGTNLLRKVKIYLLTSCNTEERIAQNIYIHNSNRNYKKSTTRILVDFL